MMNQAKQLERLRRDTEGLDITMIAAMTIHRGIGRRGELLCRNSEDLAFFKEYTMGKTCVVGRTTYEGLPPLEGRRLFLYTSALHRGDMKIDFGEDPGEIVVIGGAKTYQAWLPVANKLLLTVWDADPKTLPTPDTFFPKLNPIEWKLITDGYRVFNGGKVRLYVRVNRHDAP